MPIDFNKEVQDFGPYKLVIRQRKGEVNTQAVLWRSGERIASASAPSREQAYDDMLRALSLRQLERAAQASSATPAVEKIADAFRFLWPQLNAAQQTMLRLLHAHGEMTASELADSTAYQSHGGVNLWLGRAAVFFMEECPRSDMLLNEDGSEVVTSWFCTWSEETRKWTLRPEVADGMRLAHCVPPAA